MERFHMKGAVWAQGLLRVAQGGADVAQLMGPYICAWQHHGKRWLEILAPRSAVVFQITSGPN